MDLTPIPTPGKNRTSKSKAALVGRKRLTRPQVRGRRGRPLKMPASPRSISPSTGKSARRVKKIKHRSLKNIKSRRKMSPLEKLPTEILESIFFDCMNLELPRASPVIAGKLSSSSVYNRVLVTAFGCTWEQEFSQGTSEDGESFTEPDLVKLQSEILRCHWISVPLILNAKTAFAEKMSVSLEVIPQKSFESGFKSFQKSCGQVRSFQSYEKVPLSIWEGDSRLLKVEIPDSLLEGPWDEDKVRLLYWMVKSGASIDWAKSTKGEVALVGLDNAVTTGNLLALHLLIQAGVREKLKYNNVIRALKKAGGKRASLVKNVLYAMPTFTSEDQNTLRKLLMGFAYRAALDQDEEFAARISSVLHTRELAF